MSNMADDDDYYAAIPKLYYSERRMKDTASRVPVEVLMQDQIWIDSVKHVWPIQKLQNGHLDNLIKWLMENDGHWKVPDTNGAVTYSVIISPLYKALVAEQERRKPQRNLTARQALKDVLLNDLIDVSAITSPMKRTDKFIATIIYGLRMRGWEIRRIQK